MNIIMTVDVSNVLADISTKGNIEPGIEQGLDRAGAFLEVKMIEKIDSNIAPALHPATIARKGSSTSLFNTGEMEGQITHSVKGLFVDVGVIGSKAWIAEVHEFGKDIAVTPAMRNFLHTIGIHLKASTNFIHIPERSFIRSAAKENHDLIIEVFADELRKAIGTQ